MTLSRRRFLQAGLAVTAAAAAETLTMRLVPPAAAAASGTSPAGYVTPLAPLQPAAFLRLPPGSVQPSGWLATQLDREANGLCGQYPQVSHFLDMSTTGWINPSRVGWEEVPYWLRGFIPLAQVTGNSSLRATADQWVSGILATAS